MKKEHRKEYDRIRGIEYYRRPEVILRRKIYRKNHPEQNACSRSKYLKKFSNIVGMTEWEYKWAINIWSKLIRERDLQICVNCGSTEDLQAHHQYPKAQYPELTFVLNNGVTLCKECHKYETFNEKILCNGKFITE